jgi:hypothetical protein
MKKQVYFRQHMVFKMAIVCIKKGNSYGRKRVFVGINLQKERTENNQGSLDDCRYHLRGFRRSWNSVAHFANDALSVGRCSLLLQKFA